MKTILIILTLALYLQQPLNAQTINVNPVSCLPDSILNLPITYTNVINFNTSILGVNIGTVDYKIGTDLSGKKHISIDWESLTNQNPNMSDLAIREFIINRILRGSGSGSYNVYYKENCLQDKVCTISLAKAPPFFPVDSSVCCEVPLDVQFFESNFYQDALVSERNWYFDIINKVVCGFKCCMDEYIITSHTMPIHLRITRSQGQDFGTSTTSCPESNGHHCKKRYSQGPNGEEIIGTYPTGRRVVYPCEDEGCYQWR